MSEQLKAKGQKKENNLEVVEIEKYQTAGRDERIGVLKTYKLYIDGQFPRTESGRYYEPLGANGEPLANVCLGSRKDFRNAVVAARKAFPGWAERSAYNRGQILYRIAEMLEGRREQFASELTIMGASRKEADREVSTSIDRLVHYAGWSDKYQQLFSSANPVSSSHFNFSLPEPVGVVSGIAPAGAPLLGLVSCVAPIIVGGNSCIMLACEQRPLSAITFAEVLVSSDVPAGVVNILTGRQSELLSHFSTHMDVNAILYAGGDSEGIRAVQQNASLNIKRVSIVDRADWLSDEAQDPYLIMEFQEIKTTWHPIGV